MSFVSPSTASNVYGMFVEAAVAGTNAFITNNYAAGFSGSIQIQPGSIVGQGIVLGSDPSSNTRATLHMAVNPTSINYTLRGDGNITVLNGPGQVFISTGTSNLSRVFINDSVRKVESSCKDVLASCSTGDDLRMQLAALRRFTKNLPINTTELRRKIADKMIEDGKYSF